MPSTTCGWCGRFSNMTRASEVIESRQSWPSESKRVTVAYTCDYCASISVAVHAGEFPGAIAMSEWLDKIESRLDWQPKALIGRRFEDVPGHIAEAASEAHACLGMGAHRAAVLLARAVIEATAKEKGIADGRLVEKIDRLHSEGRIREHIRDGAHEVRHLGNDMAHGDFVEPVEPEEAEEIIGLMGEVLEEVFQSPARVARRRDARLAKKSGGEAAGS